MFGDDSDDERELSQTARITLGLVFGLGVAAISMIAVADETAVGARLAFGAGMGTTTATVVYLLTYVPSEFVCILDLFDLLACVAEFLLAILL